MLRRLRQVSASLSDSLAAAPITAAPGIQHGSEADDPLSRWLVLMLNRGPVQGNVACHCTVARTVSSALLAEAFRIVLARHDILRTSYLELGGQLTPQRLDASVFRLHTVDLSHLAEAGHAELGRRMRTEALKPFTLSNALPIRATLFTAFPAHAVLLIVAHDMACDATSLCMAAVEVQEAMLSLETGKAVPSARSPQFADHARRMLQQLAQAGDQVDAASARDALQGARPTSIPGAKPLGDAALPCSGTIELVLPAHAAAKLAAMAPQEHLATGAAAVAALLRCYSGEDDVVFGVWTSTRRENDERTIGCFDAELAVRVGAENDRDASTFLKRTETALAAARARLNAFLSYKDETPVSEGKATARPALPVQFELRHEIGAGQGPFGNPKRFRTRPPHDLLFGLASGTARLTCDYHAGRRDAGSVRRLLRTLARLLEGMLSTPGQPVRAFPLLDEADRWNLLEGLNPTNAAWSPASAARLFDKQAGRSPDATALICGEQRMSYAELAAASNRLARHLAAHGAKCGERVGICLDRRSELVVALLAVLKTGAAFVPLDPAYPADRLSYMLTDCGARLVLCRAGLPPGVQAPGATALVLDEVDWAAEASSPAAAEAAPEQSAYVIYTSGSTGRPKGVVLPHRALTNLLNSMRKTFGVGTSDTWLAVTTFSFDIATLELLLPLIVGGRLVIAQQPEVADGGALLDLMQRHEVTVMQATPSRWRLLIEAGWTGLPRLKVIAGGEKLQRDLADELLARGKVWNMYGPTETTIWSTAQPVEAGLDDIPIGRPIDNTRLYVLDQCGELLPRGAIGELYIGGVGVGIGYVGLPGLSSKRFLADPFRSATPSATMYRTGDLVRWREDGTLDYLGRADHQIKLRGLRIEPGEIEAVLQRHPAVRQALVLVRPKPWGGEDMLVAYVAPQTFQTDAQAGLRPELDVLLQRHLPGFMHPEAILVLPQFPLTLNGKVDRSALPAPQQAGPDAANDPPDTATERRLARIWQDVLGLPEVGALDDFFELGGTSLLAARLLAQVQAAFGRRLGLAALHEARTVRALARLLDGAEGERDVAEEGASKPMQVVHLQRDGGEPPIFGLHNTTVFYSLAKLLGPRRPFIAIEALKRLEAGQTASVSLPEIAASYLQEIRRVQPHGPYILLGWCAGGVIAYETAQQLTAQGQSVPLVIMVDADAPERAAAKPTLRTQLGRASYLWQRTWSYGKRLLAQGRDESLLRRLRWVRNKHSRRGTQQERALNLVDRQMIRQLDRAIRDYKPSPYPGRVLLFQRASRPSGPFIDPTAGWGRLVAGDLRVRRAFGEHVTLFLDDSARHLAEQITEMLLD